MQCATLGDVIKANSYTHIDLLSLDVEGAELSVLQTHDWTIPIHVIVVEMTNNVDKIRDFLSKAGYYSTRPGWDIREYCPNIKACPVNEVFVQKGWTKVIHQH